MQEPQSTQGSQVLLARATDEVQTAGQSETEWRERRGKTAQFEGERATVAEDSSPALEWRDKERETQRVCK